MDAGCPSRADWEARKHQPGAANDKLGVGPEEDKQVPAVAVLAAPKVRDLDDFRRFIAAGCTRAEWEASKRQSGADNQAQPRQSKTS